MNDKLSRQVARRAMLGIGVSAAALMAAPAFAQDAPVRTAPSDSGDYTVESITITAQRRSEENIKVPVAVTALGAEELQTSPPTTSPTSPSRSRTC
jgi:iron complex outermembrane receptor protein